MSQKVPGPLEASMRAGATCRSSLLLLLEPLNMGRPAHPRLGKLPSFVGQITR